MPYWKCYYHVVWATKHRETIMIPPFEEMIYAAVEQKSAELGAKILAINGAYDHVHVAVTIPPRMAVAKWVGVVKGASSRAINTGFEFDTRFRWQKGYGVMSFGERALTFVCWYIANQKERHDEGDVNSHLEWIEE